MTEARSSGRSRPTRRRFIAQAALAAGGALAGLGAGRAAAAVPWASACSTELAEPAREYAAQALGGLAPEQLWDAHCHLLGNGDSGSGCYLHPSLLRGWNLLERLRKRMILDAACVDSDALSIDRAYLERLHALAQGLPPGARCLLFAFEQAHDESGRADRERTTMHVPDRYAAEVARRHPQHFGWVASIHPYRADALEALEAAAAQGAQALKWLPSSMNIDLRDARSGRFAERASALRLPLIVHCGEEHAVPGARRDELVNPLHVRALLERGATVIVAHCASLGGAADLDRPSAPTVPAFDLFARLMDERAHGERLLGDTAALFQVNRDASVWRAVLQREDWHPRLLHGSDYPLPGLKPLVSLSRLNRAGVLPETAIEPLSALREHNPLLFDLVLKRSLGIGQARLSNSVFAVRRHFEAATRAGRRP